MISSQITNFSYYSPSKQRGSHIIVCTPGRLLDFVEKEMLSFEDVRFMVLDEADRMLDMGFMPAVEKVMNHPTMASVVSSRLSLKSELS